jgi:mannose/fructose-specific phosphotransferase system component IIA
MSRVPALLVTHADLSAALLRAAETVYGPIDDIAVMSNEGLSREALEQAIVDRVSAWTEGGLVFTDFWGGSCHICGVTAARTRKDAGDRTGEIVILTGINLPTLIDYLHNRDRFAVAELAERLRVKGQDSIRVQRGQAA